MSQEVHETCSECAGLQGGYKPLRLGGGAYPLGEAPGKESA